MRSSAILFSVLAATAAADFSIWRVFDEKTDCVDAHCRPVTEGITIQIAKFNDCKHHSEDATPLNGKGGATDLSKGVLWAKGACSSGKNYQCTKNKDGSYSCKSPGGKTSTCTKPKRPGMFTCHHGFGGNYAYNEMLACKGDVHC